MRYRFLKLLTLFCFIALTPIHQSLLSSEAEKNFSDIDKQNIQENFSILGPGDIISIDFIGAKELSSKFQILSDGNIQLPLIGSHSFTGLTLNDAKNKLIKLFSNELIRPEINLNLISDNSDEKFDNHIKKLLFSKRFKTNKYNTKINGNRGSYLECCDNAMNSEDLIFFIEDDYLFEKKCIDEMIFTYSRLSSILGKEIIMCPSDYPFYYDSLYNTNLYFGKNLRWRNVEETLLTFLFSKKILLQNLNSFRKVGKQENNPFEKPLHQIYKEIPCLAPITSLSYHIGRDNPSLNEDYLSLWNINLNIYNNLNLSSDHS